LAVLWFCFQLVLVSISIFLQVVMLLQVAPQHSLTDFCSNKELMNQQANVQSSLVFHTLALKVYAQSF